MMNCPFCACDLTRSTLNGERCPSCGARLIWDEPEDDPAALGGTPQNELPRSPVVEDRKFSVKEILATFIGRAPFESTQEAGEAPARPPVSDEPAQGISSDALATGDSTGNNEPAGAIPSRAGSELPPPPAPSTPAENMRTIDPRELSHEQAELLSIVWQPVIPPDATTRMTLKSAQQRTAISGDLAVSPRRVQRSEDAQIKSADYRLLERIGEGGVGNVYAARQASVHRTVAVKMLKPEFENDPDHRDKFLIEAVVTADLEHPNIVPIYELGADQTDAMFYSMKRVQGTPWSEEIQAKSTAENVDILMKVADAIAFAHSRGVVHRDVKPENVMLGDFGEVLLMDWGLALSTSAYLKADSITESSSMGGTPAYMAPELATGPLSVIGECSDIYLLGAALFELITGQPPHTGSDVLECLRAAARNEIVPTSKYGELLDIAYQALSTRPEDRPASVQEFQAAIRQYESHSESIVLSKVAAENLTLARQTKDYQDYARAVFGYEEALIIWDANAPARSGLKTCKFDYARAAHKKGDYDLALSLLDAGQPEQARLLREIQHARDERTARQRRLKTTRQMVLALAATVFVVVTGALWWVNSANKNLNRLNKSLEDSTAEAVKLKGEAVDAQSKAEQSRQDAVDSQSEALASQSDAEKSQQFAEAASYVAQIRLAAERIDNNAFIDASDLLDACGNDDADADHRSDFEWRHLDYLIRLADKTLKTAARVESVACSDDDGGRWLVAGTSDGQLYVRDRQSDGNDDWLRPFSLPSPRGPVYAVAISADGQLVFSGGESSGEILVWKRKIDDGSFERHKSLRGHTSTINSLHLYENDTKLLSSSADGTARLWDLKSGQLTDTFRHLNAVHAAAIHPADSHVVTVSDGTVRIWQVLSKEGDERVPGSGDKSVIRFKGHQNEFYVADFSPDGVQVAAAGRDGRIYIWDWQEALSVSTLQNKWAEEVILTVEGDQVTAFQFKHLEDALNEDIHDPQIEKRAVDIKLRVLPGHSADEVRSLSFADGSYDGREGNFLVTSGHDNIVKVWNLSSDSIDPLFRFRGHGGWVRSAIFLPGSSLIASGGYDKQVKIWDPRKYEEVRKLVLQKLALRGESADASLSRDGDRVIIAGQNGIAYVWDIILGQRMVELRDTGSEVGGDDVTYTFLSRLDEGHEFLVSSAIFFPAAEHQLLTSAGDGTVRLWDYITGGQLRSFESTGPNAAMTLSDNGLWLLTGGQRNEAKLWEVEEESKKPAATLDGHRHQVTALAISPDEKLEERRLFTGDAAGFCKLWRWNVRSESWECERDLDGHLRGRPITSATFLPDGRHLLTASRDHAVMRWEVATGKLLVDSTLKHPGGVQSMDVSSDGWQAVTVCQDAGGTGGQLRHWDLKNSKLLHSHIVRGPTITSIAMSCDNESALVVVKADRSRGTVYRWEFESNHYDRLSMDRIGGPVWAVITSSDPGKIVTVGGNHARLWQEPEDASKEWKLNQSFGPHASLNAAAFSPSGKLAVTAGSDGAVKIWNVDPKAQGHRVVAKIAAACGWDEKLEKPYAVNSAVFGPHVLADSSVHLLTAGDDFKARLWRLRGREQPELLATLSGHTGPIQQAVFSRDGKRIATASKDGTTKLWDASEPENVKELPIKIPREGTQAPFTCVSFSRDGKRLVTGGEDNIAQIWNLEDMTELPIALKGHAAGLTSVGFSPDGRRVVSGSIDKMAIVWDARSVRFDDTDEAQDARSYENLNRHLLSLNRHDAEVMAVEFSDDGNRILTASRDGTVIVWPTSPIGTE